MDQSSTDLFVRAATRADGEMLRVFLTKAAKDENIEAFDVLGYVQAFVLPVAQVDAGQLFIATRGWTIVGLASALFRQEGGIEIDALLIDPDEDRHAAGARLVDQCKAFARGVNANEIHATAIETAGPILNGWGFEADGIDDTIMGSVALKMRATL